MPVALVCCDGPPGSVRKPASLRAPVTGLPQTVSTGLCPARPAPAEGYPPSRGPMRVPPVRPQPLPRSMCQNRAAASPSLLPAAPSSIVVAGLGVACLLLRLLSLPASLLLLLRRTLLAAPSSIVVAGLGVACLLLRLLSLPASLLPLSSTHQSVCRVCSDAASTPSPSAAVARRRRHGAGCPSP